jgi:hypothetical protein
MSCDKAGFILTASVNTSSKSGSSRIFSLFSLKGRTPDTTRHKHSAVLVNEKKKAII